MSGDDVIGPAGRAAHLLRDRGRLIGAAVTAAAAATAVTVARRRQRDTLALPDPGPIAAETATSVHNAAKGSVIAAVREADAPDRVLVDGAIRDAVTDAGSSGADVIAAAIGAVEGSFVVAHLIAVEPRQLATDAAVAAVDAAALQGSVAADRVRDVLWPHLSSAPSPTARPSSSEGCRGSSTSEPRAGDSRRTAGERCGSSRQ